ncbi:MAG: ArsR/SmtB family transcription factor [Thermoguttaceae bacterium]
MTKTINFVNKIDQANNKNISNSKIINSKTVAKLPHEFLSSMAEVIRILGNGQRLRILEHLDFHGECNVSNIVESLDAQQGAISQHLSKMQKAGLLSCRRVSREVFYKIAEEKAITILNCIRKKYEEIK